MCECVWDSFKVQTNNEKHIQLFQHLLNTEVSVWHTQASVVRLAVIASQVLDKILQQSLTSVIIHMIHAASLQKEVCR